MGLNMVDVTRYGADIYDRQLEPNRGEDAIGIIIIICFETNIAKLMISNKKRDIIKFVQ